MNKLSRDNIYRLIFWDRRYFNPHMVHECEYLFDSFDSALSYALESILDSVWSITTYDYELVARSAYV